MTYQTATARNFTDDELLCQLPHLEKVSNVRALFSITIDWLAIMSLVFLGTQAPWYFVPVFVAIIGGLQHGLLILMHEQVHFHLFTNNKLGEIVSDIFLSLPILVSTKLYRNTHYRHHAELNSKNDPDLKFMKERKEWSIPKSKRALYWLLFKDLTLLNFRENFINGPVTLMWSPLARLFRSESDPNGGLSLSYRLFIVAYYGSIIGTISMFSLWTTVILFWILPLMTVLPASVRMRALPEHLGLQEGASEDSCRTVWPLSFIEQIMIAPHGISIHQEHHANPRIPFYRLNEAHKILATRSQKMNHYQSYLGNNGALAKLIERAPEVQ